MFSSRDTVRYEERGQGYRNVEKVGKHVEFQASLAHHQELRKKHWGCTHSFLRSWRWASDARNM